MSDVAKHEGGALVALADQANEEHRQAEAAMTEALVHARNAGEALNEAKDRTPHGSWGDWVRDHFEGSARTARLYQRIARNWTRIEDRQRVADLSLRGAVRLLREGGGDEEAEPEDVEPGRVEPGVAYYLRFPDWIMGFDYGWIWPSHHDGYSWVTFVDAGPEPDSDGSVTTWNRPLRCDMMETVFEAVRVPHEDAEWKAFGEPEPTDYNRLLYNSRREQTAAELKRWAQPEDFQSQADRRRRHALKEWNY